MGFNFQAGHPTGIFEGKYAQRVAEQFQAKFGASLPLGKEGLLGKGRVFRLRDEIGWSWWGELQELGKEELGEKACPQLLGADAWSAVYVDAKVDRDTIWPDGKSTTGKKASWEVASGSRDDVPEALRSVLDNVVSKLGARSGEQGGMQVGNLRALMAELELLLAKRNVKPQKAAVEELLKTYSDDDRAEADPAIQCLCHAWLTGSHALEHGCPMWLVK